MRVSDLLAEDSLQLRLHTPSTAQRLATSISYTAPAEFLDPTPFLGANCLLITHGIGFNFFDQRTWDAYVERLAGVPVCAIAFVTGVAHRLIPTPLVEAAKAHGIPLLEVPSVVPALQLQRFVTSVLEAERFALTRQSWELADLCAKAARSGGSLRAVLAEVAAAAEGQCAVFDTTGALISCWPASSRWTAEDLRHDARGASGSSFALPTGGTEHFQLVVRGGTTGEPLATLIGPASSILAMQLNSAFKASAPHQAKLERLMQQLGGLAGCGPEGADPDLPRHRPGPARPHLPGGGRAGQGPTAACLADPAGSAGAPEQRPCLHVSRLVLRPRAGPDGHRRGLGCHSGPAAGLSPAGGARAVPRYQGALGQRG